MLKITRRLSLAFLLCAGGFWNTGQTANAVKFTDHAESVSLENGIVSFEVNKATGDILALTLPPRSSGTATITVGGGYG